MNSQTEELKQRVTAKRKKIESEIARLRADASATARDKLSELEAKLSEARNVVDGGWDRLTESGAAMLNRWLKDD